MNNQEHALQHTTLRIVRGIDAINLAAGAALEHGIARVVVDRGGFRYHGRVREIVEAAVAAGLSIGEKDKTEEESK